MRKGKHMGKWIIARKNRELELKNRELEERNRKQEENLKAAEHEIKRLSAAKEELRIQMEDMMRECSDEDVCRELRKAIIRACDGTNAFDDRNQMRVMLGIATEAPDASDITKLVEAYCKLVSEVYG